MQRANAHPTLALSIRSHAASGLCRAGAVVAASVVMAFAGAGCSRAGDSITGIVKAPIRGTAELTGFATTTPEPKDFVKETRNPNADFMPVGVTPPPRSLRVKTPAEIKAMEADLQDTLQKHNAAAGRTPTGETFKSAASSGPKTDAKPRGSDRFLIKPKPAETPTPTKPKSGKQTNS